MTQEGEKKTGPEIMSEVCAEPTLDEYMRRAGPTITDEELPGLVKVLRRERAAFINAKSK